MEVEYVTAAVYAIYDSVGNDLVTGKKFLTSAELLLFWQASSQSDVPAALLTGETTSSSPVELLCVSDDIIYVKDNMTCMIHLLLKGDGAMMERCKWVFFFLCICYMKCNCLVTYVAYLQLHVSLSSVVEIWAYWLKQVLNKVICKTV